MEDRHIKSAIKILKTISYINIATVCEDGSPWNSPLAANFDTDLNFYWASSPDNVHSQNVRREERVFAVMYDSTVSEGTGEAVYMKGVVVELDFEPGTAVKKYRFSPSQLWINDDAKNDDGSYKYDIRVKLDITILKQSLF